MQRCVRVRRFSPTTMLVASEGTMLAGMMAAYSFEDGMDRPTRSEHIIHKPILTEYAQNVMECM